MLSLIAMPQFQQIALKIFIRFFRVRYFCSGNWSGIRAEITIKRKMGYFLVHVYSPSALIVVLSWISFCIPLESTAARVTLGITSVLTTTTILNILNNSMPKVVLLFIY